MALRDGNELRTGAQASSVILSATIPAPRAAVDTAFASVLADVADSDRHEPVAPVKVSRRTRVMRPYQLRAVLSDIIAICIGLVLAWAITPQSAGSVAESAASVGMVVVAWAASLGFRRSYESRFLGTGIDEYKRVISAAVIAFSLVCMVSFMTNLAWSRGFVVLAMGIATALVVTGRWILRGWLQRERFKGNFRQRTWLVVSSTDQVSTLTTALDSDPAKEFDVVGMSTLPDDESLLDSWLERELSRMKDVGVDSVAVANGAATRRAVIQALGWRLEGTFVSLLVAQDFVDELGPRISVRPAGGIPFLLLEEPQLVGPQAMFKRSFDIVGASLLLVIAAPVMAVCAIAVKMSSKGAVIYRQQRIGRDGNLFTFPKFRTMVVGAHDMRSDVIGAPDEDISERYRNDPRITGPGRILRRFSLDELPQLLKVITGEMSLVGPRPLLPEEAVLLEGVDHRRHLAVPGLTGLWQIGGRKETTWEERMNLDLRYVDSWSPVLDVLILARTVRALLTGHGAY